MSLAVSETSFQYDIYLELVCTMEASSFLSWVSVVYYLRIKPITLTRVNPIFAAENKERS